MHTGPRRTEVLGDLAHGHRLGPRAIRATALDVFGGSHEAREPAGGVALAGGDQRGERGFDVLADQPCTASLGVDASRPDGAEAGTLRPMCARMPRCFLPFGRAL
jgi:hypothetical protein